VSIDIPSSKFYRWTTLLKRRSIDEECNDLLATMKTVDRETRFFEGSRSFRTSVCLLPFALSSILISIGQWCLDQLRSRESEKRLGLRKFAE